MLGWDEMLEGGLAPGATVMSWTGVKGGTEAARLHHDAIMTPIQYLYFSNPTYNRIKGTKSLERVYTFEPVSNELGEDERKIYHRNMRMHMDRMDAVQFERWKGKFFLVWLPCPRFNGRNRYIKILTVS